MALKMELFFLHLIIVTELALQPHIAHNIGTGTGGNNNDTRWGEDDKNRYKPKRRR